MLFFTASVCRRGWVLMLWLGFLLCLHQGAVAQANKKGRNVVPQAGRLYLADGSVRHDELLLLDYNQLKGIGADGVEVIYSPDEVNSFVMSTDSFTVLRDFYVTLTRDAEHYKSSFMRVRAAGAGLEFYEFRGTMTRKQFDGGNAALFAAGIAIRVVAGNTAIPGGIGSPEREVMTTAWLLRRDGNPRWLTLPTGARNIREVIEPLIADDEELAATVHWGSIRREDVADLLSQYVEHKKH